MESINTGNVMLSLENTTKKKLLANGIFTGKSVNVKRFVQVVVNCVSDQECCTTSDGIKIQFSSDELNWDTKHTTCLKEDKGVFSVNASFLITGSHMRVIYENGPTTQGVFSLNVYLKLFRDPELLGTVNSVIQKDQVTNIIRLGSEYKRDVALGKIDGNTNFIVNGTRLLGVDNVMTTISSIESVEYIFPQIARKIYCFSDKIEDTYGTGPGAWVLVVFGLDVNFNEIVEIINVTGTTNSALTQQEFIRINNFACVAVGSYTSSNIGHIRLFSDIDHYELSCICPGHGRSINAVYTIPRGYSCVIPRVSFICGKNHTADFTGYFRENNVPIGGPPYKSKMIINTISDFTGIVEMKPEEFVRFNECTDIWVVAAKKSGEGSAEVSIIYDIDLIRNN